MKNSEELREEARCLRGLAEHSTYPDMAERFREMAREYDRMADRAEEHETLGLQEWQWGRLLYPVPHARSCLNISTVETERRDHPRVAVDVIKRLEDSAVSIADTKKDTFGPPKELRKLLREAPGVQMWQVDETRPRPGHRTPMIYYAVTCGGAEKTFGRPYEAWEYFRRLTDAPRQGR